jgi:Spy/CpxP family protein refolding chaperone
MKKLLFAAGLLCFGLSTTTFAQDAKKGSTPTSSRLDPKRMAAMRANRLEKELSLTPEQKVKVQDIFSNIIIESKDDRRMVEKETEQKIKAILTPEQVQKYDDMITKREELRKQQLDADQAK